jgi:hypothetical protein
LNLSNPLGDTPYASLFKGMTPEAALAAEKGTQSAFEPGITSIESQIKSSNDAVGKFNDLVNTALEVARPKGLYTMAINHLTGLPDGFNSSSGKWASQESSGGGTGSGVNETTPSTLDLTSTGGIDFSGAATSTQPYATDPNYTTEVAGTYAHVQQAVPQPSAEAYDLYLKNFKSPLTGQMIMSAASTYNVDPGILAATLQHESDFGTAGAATSTNNPGNVGNTGTSTKTFNSWNAGVMAAAAELAKRMPGNANAGQPANYSQGATSPVGGKFSAEATAKVAKVATYLQSYVDAGPEGVAYINDDRVPTNLKQIAQMQASKAGIPYLPASDAAAVKSIGIIEEQLKNMGTLVADNLNGTGSKWQEAVGKGIDIGKTVLNNFFGVYPELDKFNSYRDSAIKAVQALSGGQGSGLRITGAEIAANLQNFPETTNNLDQASARIAQMKTYLNTALRATFPYVTPVNINNGGTGGGQVTVSAGGTTYTFPDQASANAFKAKAGIQ